MDASKFLVDFIVNTHFQDLPDKAISVIKMQVLDIIAIAIGGMDRNEIKIIREIFRQRGGQEEATLWGVGKKVPTPNAALVNSITSFCLDFDDIHDRGNLHGGVTVVPVAFAIAETIGKVNGRQLIESISLGLEFGVRMGMAAKRRVPNHIMGGWDYAALHGSFAATVVAGKMMGLNREKLHNALGIVYHQTSGNGLSALDLADTKKMGPGFASQAAINSVLFANAGLSGAHRIMHETDQSFYSLYHSGCEEQALLNNLGQHFEFVDLGFKPYPSCRLGHAHIDAVLKLVQDNQLNPEEIIAIDLSVCDFAHLQLCTPETTKKQPGSAIAAQFSLPWVVACAAVRGKVGIMEMDDKAINDPFIKAMAEKVNTISDPSLADELVPAPVTIKTSRGDFTVNTGPALGSVENPMSFDDIENKLRQCAGMRSERIEENRLKLLVKRIKDLENVNDVSEIIALFN